MLHFGPDSIISLFLMGFDEDGVVGFIADLKERAMTVVVELRGNFGSGVSVK